MQTKVMQPSNGLLPSIVVVFVFASVVCRAQEPNNDELARQLANSESRVLAITAIRNSASDKTALLLSWTTTPPRGLGISQEELYIGLADAFAALKVNAAIPFLIKYIGMTRSLMRPNVWLKSDEAILSEFPAVRALVHLGAAASKAVVDTSWVDRSSEDRLRALFVVAQIADPGARDFLNTALRQAGAQQYWASEGIRRMEKR